jgi:hypothetical protein
MRVCGSRGLVELAVNLRTRRARYSPKRKRVTLSCDNFLANGRKDFDGRTMVDVSISTVTGLSTAGSPQFWLGLQMDYGFDVTADALANRLKREVKPHALAA